MELGHGVLVVIRSAWIAFLDAWTPLVDESPIEFARSVGWLRLRLLYALNGIRIYPRFKFWWQAEFH